MTTASQELGERFEQNLVIAAPPARVFECFFAPEALRAWWQAIRSVTTPSPFGVYAIEWATTPYRDDLLGPLGGVFHGTVVDVKLGQQFLVADSWWIPPEGDPVGPMVLHVSCQPDATGCRLNVRQDGCDPSPRWRRYYAVASRGWQISLTALKRYAESGAGQDRRKGPPDRRQPEIRSTSETGSTSEMRSTSETSSTSEEEPRSTDGQETRSTSEDRSIPGPSRAGGPVWPVDD